MQNLINAALDYFCIFGFVFHLSEHNNGQLSFRICKIGQPRCQTVTGLRLSLLESLDLNMCVAGTPKFNLADSCSPKLILFFFRQDRYFCQVSVTSLFGTPNKYKALKVDLITICITHTFNMVSNYPLSILIFTLGKIPKVVQ